MDQVNATARPPVLKQAGAPASAGRPSARGDVQLECPNCQAVAVNRDFCSCGAYLAWHVPHRTSDIAEPDPEAPRQGGHRDPARPEGYASTLLTLRDPEQSEASAGSAVSVTLVPGDEAVLVAKIRNQGVIVDRFDLRVEGLPEQWRTITYPTVFLNPWGTAEKCEAEIKLRLHPPRAPEAHAQSWSFSVIARSEKQGKDVAKVSATLTVLPFVATAMVVRPERVRARRGAVFNVGVENRGNSPVQVALRAKDVEERCPVAIGPATRRIAIGQVGSAVVRAGVERPRVIGRPTQHKLEISHVVAGDEAYPGERVVVFQQLPWIPLWVPIVIVALAAAIVAWQLNRPPLKAPQMAGVELRHAHDLLGKRGLQVGKVTWKSSRDSADWKHVMSQRPAPGAAVEKGETVDLVVGKEPVVAPVPAVVGLTLATAVERMHEAVLDPDVQPPSAGNDWVITRQHPSPGTDLSEHGKVLLATEAPPTPTPTPEPTPKPKPTPTPTPTPNGRDGKNTQAAGSSSKPADAKQKADVAKSVSPPKDLVFAGATSGQLYRWSSKRSRVARLTAPTLRLETPTPVDSGYVAVQVAGRQRPLVTVSADGGTVAPLAEGRFFRPAYSSSRDLVAVIAGNGKDDAGQLCVLYPQDPTGATTCAHGPRVGRPVWAPNGRSVLALGAGSNGYARVLSFHAAGADATKWRRPVTVYRAPNLRAAAWVGNNRLAVLVASRPNGAAHLRLLSRKPDGTFVAAKEFPELTGSELAGTGTLLVLQRASDASDDGAMTLLDIDRPQPRVRRLASGTNPAWVQ
jgi:hypothetical protein